MALAVGGEEAADRLLGRDVEPERRLVEEQDRRTVQQGRGQLALHPLAERQLAHGFLEHLA